MAVRQLSVVHREVGWCKADSGANVNVYGDAGSFYAVFYGGLSASWDRHVNPSPYS